MSMAPSCKAILTSSESLRPLSGARSSTSSSCVANGPTASPPSWQSSLICRLSRDNLSASELSRPSSSSTFMALPYRRSLACPPRGGSVAASWTSRPRASVRSAREESASLGLGFASGSPHLCVFDSTAGAAVYGFGSGAAATDVSCAHDSSPSTGTTVISSPVRSKCGDASSQRRKTASSPNGGAASCGDASASFSSSSSMRSTSVPSTPLRFCGDTSTAIVRSSGVGPARHLISQSSRNSE
mmetsp:Transcript_75376/g.174737  ORF Transcript_75376/g.174737 Transcript_75376/m.174737 type:complete len:243 (+) Transcript_75376:927-1655(+)